MARLVVLAVVAVCALLAALAAWQLWFRYDDASDIQGVWQVEGSDYAIVIDQDKVKLSSDVAYSYAVDANAKTVSFTLGHEQGGASYRFSADRTRLLVQDGGSTDWLAQLHVSADPVFDEGQLPDGALVLQKVSDDTAAAPGKTGLAAAQGTSNGSAGASSSAASGATASGATS